MWKTELLKNCRRVNTGLAGPKALAIIDSIFGQLSDGYWENSPRMGSYWHFMCSDVREDGTVDICVSQESGQMYCQRWIANKPKWLTPAELLKWFADKIYAIAKAEAEDWASDEYRAAKGNQGVSKYLSRDGVQLTGNDVWELRRALIEASRGYQ